MSKRFPHTPLFLIISFIIFFAFTGGHALSSDAPDPKALFEKRCSRCHSLDRTEQNKTEDYWKATVERMKKKFFSGISDEEAKIITDYLIKTKTD